MSIIAFIPVRGGSKSIPMKNIKIFCGKPLLYWSIKALQDAKDVSRIFVATDDCTIKHTVESFNFSKIEVYERLPENATDTASTESVMLEFLERCKIPENDVFILAQATCPFLEAKDIEAALRLYYETGADSLLSCVRVKRFFWNEDGSPINYDYTKRPRRQEFRGTFMENGAFYINTVANIKKYKNRLCGKIVIYEMADFKSVELDEEDDWFIAENTMRKYILPNRKEKIKIKLFLSDVDGTLTDGGMYYSDRGEKLKKFNTIDGMGFELLRRVGIKTGIITSEKSKIVVARAKKLKLDYVLTGVSDKLEVVKKLCDNLGIDLKEVAYIGDDINCKSLLERVGLGACPTNAAEEIKSIPQIIILKRRGGEGAVREFVERVLENV